MAMASTQTTALHQSYRALCEGHIRVFLLLPGQESDQIHCQLSACISYSKVSYEAISYVWGDMACPRSILLDEKPFNVGENLFRCLQHMRHDCEPRTLWADAVCINQLDMREKCSQISLMPEIFKSARRTLIWLECDFGWSDPEEVHRFSDAFTLVKELGDGQHVLHSPENALRAQYLALVSRVQWWARVWVVQETLLSQSAHLVASDSTVPWNVLVEAAKNFIRHASTCCSTIHQASSAKRRHGVTIHRYLAEFVRVVLSFQRIPAGVTNQILANLWMYRSRLSSLDHDKVFGILGLVDSTPSELTPGDNIPFSTICSNVVIDDIRASRNLHCLRGIRTEVAQDLPSWCTDWASHDYWAEDRSRILAEILVPL
jgi:hypothetical protein